MILDLGLQVEDPQRPWRREAEEGHTGGHVDEPGVQQVALADLWRTAQHQQSARRQHPGRDDVLRHRALIVQQRAQREGGHLDRSRCAGVEPDQRRAVFLDMPFPEPLGFPFQPLDRPLGPQHRGVVAADADPALVLRHPALVDHADEMTDRGRRALETGPVVLRPLAHRRDQHIVHGGLVGMGERGLQGHAWRGRHVGHGFDELGQIAFAVGVQFDDPHLRLEVVLVVDRARHPYRLMGGAEMHVAADLCGDVAAQTADARYIVTLGRFGQRPPDVALALPLGRDAAALHDHAWRAEVALEVRALGGDVTGVEIDHYRLHLQDVGGLGLAGRGHGAGDHIDCRALARGPCREGRHLLGGGMIRFQPDVVRAAIDALTLVDEAADRDQTVAIPEDDLHELRNLRRVGLVAEDVDLRRGIVEVAPRVEMDDVFLGLVGRGVVAHGWLLVGIGWLGGLVGHAARLQHRSA